MIEVAKASEKLQAPAQTLEELYERLIDYVGEVISVELEQRDGVRKRRAGRLAEIELLDLNRRILVSYSFLGVSLDKEESRKYGAFLKCLYQVRIDGQWKTFHNGR